MAKRKARSERVYPIEYIDRIGIETSGVYASKSALYDGPIDVGQLAEIKRFAKTVIEVAE